MKPAYITAMLLLSFFPAFAQDFQPTRVGRVESKFDRSTDTTTLQCSLVELGEGAPKLTVQAIASFRGKEPNETAKFVRLRQAGLPRPHGDLTAFNLHREIGEG